MCGGKSLGDRLAPTAQRGVPAPRGHTPATTARCAIAAQRASAAQVVRNSVYLQTHEKSPRNIARGWKGVILVASALNGHVLDSAVVGGLATLQWTTEPARYPSCQPR